MQSVRDSGMWEQRKGSIPQKTEMPSKDRCFKRHQTSSQVVIQDFWISNKCLYLTEEDRLEFFFHQIANS